MAMALATPEPPTNDRGWAIEDTYIIKGQIAKGGYGSVMLGQQICSFSNPPTEVAIKKTRRNPDSKVELEVLKSLTDESNHFLTHLKDVYEDATHYYFVTEYYRGGTLRQVIREAKGFSENVMKFYAAQLVSAVEYLHLKHIIHLDIKSANILLDRLGNLVLVDFGMAVRRPVPFVRWSKVHTHGAVGTPGYQSPEMLLEHTGHEANDWWAVGIVCCEMLTQKRPFVTLNNDTKELRRSILHDEPNLPEDKSAECLDFMRQLLQKNPGMRLGSCSASDVKRHKFFKDVDWDALCRKAIHPPLKSSLKYAKTLQFYNTHYSSSKITDIQQLETTCKVHFRKPRKSKSVESDPQTAHILSPTQTFPIQNEAIAVPGSWLDDRPPAAQCNLLEQASCKDLHGIQNYQDLFGTANEIAFMHPFNELRQPEPSAPPLSPLSCPGDRNNPANESPFSFEAPFAINQTPKADGEGNAPQNLEDSQFYSFGHHRAAQEENNVPFGLTENNRPANQVPFSSYTSPVPSTSAWPREERSRDISQKTRVFGPRKQEKDLPVYPEIHGHQKNYGAVRNRQQVKARTDKNGSQNWATSFSNSMLGKYFKNFRNSPENRGTLQSGNRTTDGAGQSRGLYRGGQDNAVNITEQRDEYAKPYLNLNLGTFAAPQRESGLPSTIVINPRPDGSIVSFRGLPLTEALSTLCRPDELTYTFPNYNSEQYLLNNNNPLSPTEGTDPNEEYNFNFQNDDL